MKANEKFTRKDIEDGINELAARMQNSEISNSIFIDNLLRESDDGATKMILRQIYQEFNCKFEKEKRWQNYQ